MSNKLRNISCSFLWLYSTVLLLATGAAIIILSTNQVSSRPLWFDRWEPTSAAGSTWATGWTEIDPLIPPRHLT